MVRVKSGSGGYEAGPMEHCQCKGRKYAEFLIIRKGSQNKLFSWVLAKYKKYRLKCIDFKNIHDNL